MNLFLSAAVAMIGAVPVISHAQSAANYPNKSIRMVVPSSPGGGTDIIARLLAQGFFESWGQTVVVDNRGGGGGIPAVTLVAKQSAADGYTMLLGSVGHLSFAPAIERNLAYDPRRDLAPVSLAAVQPFVITAARGFAPNTIQELITAAKAKPESITYGTGGSGSATHLGVELLALSSGIRLVHVAYKGSNLAVTAAMAGEINVALAGLATTIPHVKANRLKALAVTSAKRVAYAPEIPTVAESGVPGYVYDVWYGLVFPGGTARAIVAKTSTEVGRLLASAEVGKRFAAAGLEPAPNSPEAFAAMIAEEIPKWQKVVKAANIRVE